MKEITVTERVVLLGLPILIGATSTVFSAAGAAVLSVVLFCLLMYLRRLIPTAVPDSAQWFILCSVGLSFGVALSWIMKFVIPIQSESEIILSLIGITPLVYLGSAPHGFGHVGKHLAVFAALMLGFGVAREILGSGTILGYLVFPDFLAPAGIAAGPIGGFTIAGSIVLLARYRASVRTRRDNREKEASA